MNEGPVPGSRSVVLSGRFWVFPVEVCAYSSAYLRMQQADGDGDSDLQNA